MNYIWIARQLPVSIRDWVKQSLIYADIDIDSEKFLGFFVLFSISLAMALAANLYFIFNFNIFFGFGISFGFFLLFSYLILFFLIKNRTNFIEKVLPDALQLMSSNIDAGMTTDRALILSARPEFGPLEKEILKAGKKILSGGNLEEELILMSNRVDSVLFKRTISLIVQGLKSGGRLEKILMETANDIRSQESVRKEIEATIMLYSVLIFLAVGFAAPFLFGVSSYLAEVLGGRMASFGFMGGMSRTLNLQTGVATIPPEALVNFSIASLSLSSIFGSLVIGLIQEGEERVGTKYIPLFLFLSLSIFFLTRRLMLSMFGALLV